MNERGVSIILLAIIIVLFGLLGIVFLSLFTTGVQVSVMDLNSMRALYVAEGVGETVMGYQKQVPWNTYWAWNDGYLDKALGAGTVDVEVLQYDNADGTVTGGLDCVDFESSIESGGENDALTIYITLRWTSANAFGLNLYAGTCISPGALTASSVASAAKERTILYRIAAAPPQTIDYNVVVTGTSGDSYELRIAHPDESGFNAADIRALIALGRVQKARREVFVAYCRRGTCP